MLRRNYKICAVGIISPTNKLFSSDADSMWAFFNQEKQKAASAAEKIDQEINNDTHSVEHPHDCCDHDHHDHHAHDASSLDFDDSITVLKSTTKNERLQNFGMFGFATHENLEEIPGLFKQSWIDFFVSEIPTGQVKPASREYYLKIPDLPPWLLQTMSLQEIIGAIDDQESGTNPESILMDLGEIQQKQQQSSCDGDENNNNTTITIKPKRSVLPPPLGTRSANLISSQESLFKTPEEIESDLCRKEKKAKQMLQDAVATLQRSSGATSRDLANMINGGNGDNNINRNSNHDLPALGKKKDYYLQCILHKQGVADATARSWIAKALHVHPSAISVSGVKDFKGDTVQVIRIKNASPLAAFRGNYWIQSVLQQEKDHKAAKLQELHQGEDDVSVESKNQQPNSAVSSSSSSENHAKNMSSRSFFPKPSPNPDPASAPHLMMSHFSYQKKPLIPGNLEGNHFRIVLRDVPLSITDERLQASADSLTKFGFPNFYGCQRFSWFGPMEMDPANAIIHGDIINFAFRLLEFTGTRRTLRELLQRNRLYPTPFQESYRRAVIRRFQDNNVSPNVLDTSEYFLSCPPLGTTTEVLQSPENIELDNVRGNRRELTAIFKVFSCLRQALDDLPGTPRRLCCQSTCSFLWNLCLSERIRRFGLQQVLPGDLVVPSSLRPLRERVNQQFFATGTGRIDFVETYGRQAFSKQEIEAASVFDVFHPTFQFHDRPIVAAKQIQDIMMEICEEYNVPWYARGPKRLGVMQEFIETPRPICARVSNFFWFRRKEDPTIVEVEFTLGKGSYANVALREFLRTARACPGHEEVTLKPLTVDKWEHLGRFDPGSMQMTVEDLYPEWVPEHGVIEGPDERAENTDIYNFQGDWLRKDEKEKIQRWHGDVTLRNMERREKYNKLRKKELFEPAIGRTVSDQEMLRYAGHSVPLPPNAPRKKIQKMVFLSKMKREKNPNRRRLLAAMQRKGDRSEEYVRASKEFTWTPQR